MTRMSYPGTNTLTRPRWAGDYFDPNTHLIPGGVKVDAAQFTHSEAVAATATANAIIGATTIAVTALTGPIPSGTLLDFTGTGKLALLTAAAATGATSLTVEALAQQVNSTDVAYYGGTSGFKTILSGIPVGRTIAERDAGTPYGPAAAADDEIYLLAFDIVDANVNNDGVLYRPGSVVKENYLPTPTGGMIAGVLTKLQDKYIMQRGTN